MDILDNINDNYKYNHLGGDNNSTINQNDSSINQNDSSINQNNSGINENNSTINQNNSGINENNSTINQNNSGINENNSTINQNNSGTNNVFGVVVNSEKITNPELLYLSNPTWPPLVGKIINIKDPNDNKWYRGKTKNVIWNSTASVIHLEPQYIYQENSLKDYPEFSSGNNHYLLLPSYHWQYNDLDKMNKVQSSINDVIDRTVMNKTEISDKQNGLENNKTKQIDFGNNVSLIPNVNKNTSIKLNEHKVNHNQYFIGTEPISVKLDKSDDVKKKVINSFQSYKTNINQISDDMLIEANNPYYRPLTGLDVVDFAENKMISKIFGLNKPSLRSLSFWETQKLMEKLKKFEIINPDDIKLIVNKNISINNIINDPEDEINEGGKIIKHITKMTKGIFTDVQARIHLGYVYFTRKGAQVQDVVTKKLVPNLNYFGWQENKPIDYHTLKYVVFQNNYQKSIQENKLQKAEAENILGLEYIVAIQCKSQYIYWCMKKLFMIWYGDKELEPVIRKIKVLINHYRADPVQEYNKINGILPMIAIYPKYGIENARLLISKLEYYFSLYTEDNFNRTYQEIFYPNSNPTYFVKKNNLIYYTNGSIDLKMYIKDSLSCNDKVNDDVFTVDMSKLINTNNLIISYDKSDNKTKK
jgi:hypothetical protein